MRVVQAGMLTLLLVIALAAINAYALGTGHPDNCAACHGDDQTIQDVTYGGTSYSFWSHNISLTGDAAWKGCQSCHAQIYNELMQTVHNGFGCKGCHAVLHLGYNYQGSYYGVVFAYEVSPIGVPAIAPGNPPTWVTSWKEFTNTNINTTDPTGTLWAIVNDILTNKDSNGMEVEVYLWDAFNNTVVDTTPAGVQVSNFRVCFSCHFLATDPSQVGAYMIVNGQWKIGIPASALNQEPHSIMKVSGETFEFSETSNSNAALIALFGGLAGLGLVVYSSRSLK